MLMSSTARDQWQGTAGYDELFNAVLQVLAKRGVLAQMRANTISEVLACAKNQSGEELVQLLGNPTRDSFTSTDVGRKTFTLVREMLVALGMHCSLVAFDAESNLNLPSSAPLPPHVSAEDLGLSKLVAASMKPSGLDRVESMMASGGISAEWESSHRGEVASCPQIQRSEDENDLQRRHSPDVLQMQSGKDTPDSTTTPVPHNSPPHQPDSAPNCPPHEIEQCTLADSDAVAALLETDVEPVQASLSDCHVRPSEDAHHIEGNMNAPFSFPDVLASDQDQLLAPSEDSLSPSPPALDHIDWPSLHAPPSQTTQHHPHSSGIPRAPVSPQEQPGGTENHARDVVSTLDTLDPLDGDTDSIPEEVIEEEIEDANTSDDDGFTDIGAFVPLSGDCTMNQADLEAEVADLAPPGMQHVPPAPGSQATPAAPTQVSPEGSEGSREKDLYDILCDDAIYDEEYELGIPSLPGM